MSIGFIGGTGVYKLAGLDLEPVAVTTRFGEVTVFRGAFAGQDVVFLPRHGAGHETPPHAINYRAAMAALKALGVSTVVASSAVGTLTPAIPPGSLALLTDFLDQTHGREGTFFAEDVVHLDYTTPYCPHVRRELLETAKLCGIELHEPAVYLCTNGPRFETPAEIRMYRGWGADLVGMTNVPEVVLAREAELCYAVVAIATNSAAGLAGHPLTHGEVEEMMAARLRDLARLYDAWLRRHIDLDCPCRHALDEYRARTGQPDFAAVG